MHDFVSLLLRKYYAQTSWNPYNSYLHLTSSSNAVLDFNIPTGLSLSISASPSPPFFTTYRLRALPTLSGALGYIYASIEDDDGNPKGLNIGGSSKDVRFKDVIDRFRIIETPWRPLGKEQVFQRGRRVDRRDYLLYGCMHVPTSRVDALLTTRLSPTWQLLITAISLPPRNYRPGPHTLSEKTSDANLSASGTVAAASTATTTTTNLGGMTPGTANVQFNLQQDTGRWCSEYSYSVDDGLLGFRFMHNLGQIALQGENRASTTLPATQIRERGEKRIDEESTLESVVGGGLQGRFSVGAELFFSPLEKSAGLSTGVRFTTLPEHSSLTISDSFLNPSSGLIADQQINQPPTTITATLNPMMGHLSTAYAAKMTRDIVACSRFDFNVYSYDSDLTLGAEYWINSKSSTDSSTISGEIQQSNDYKNDELSKVFASTPTESAPSERRLQARIDSALSLRDGFSGPSLTSSRDGLGWSLRESKSEDGNPTGRGISSGNIENPLSKTLRPKSPLSYTLGVIKARLSTSGNVALLWEGRLRNCLVSFGMKADLSAASEQSMGTVRKPLRGIGLDIIYFTQNRQE